MGAHGAPWHRYGQRVGCPLTAATVVSARRRLTWLAALTAAYYATGKLALLLAIPPGYATAIWPPAGLALAGVLMLGYGAWPAVLAGSFFVNIGTSLDTSNVAAVLASCGLAGSIGAGAALQACAGAWLVRRLIGYPTLLGDEREAGKFLAVAAISCTLNATTGVTVLLATGAIQPAAYPFSWFTWWVGDTIGAIIAAPLVLIWMSDVHPSWRRRRVLVTVPMAALLLLTLMLVVRTSGWEQQRIRREFDERASRVALAMEETARGRLEDLESLRDLLTSAPGWNRSQFEAFARNLLARRHGVSGFAWDRRVLAADRSAYETAERHAGNPGFSITERDASGRLVRAAERPEYVVIASMQPHDSSSALLGFDIASEPLRRQALDAARDAGAAAALPGIRLLQDSVGSTGLVVFLPVYGPMAAPADLAERRRGLTGYAAGVFYIDELVRSSLRGTDHQGMALQLYERPTSGEARPLFRQPADAPATASGTTRQAVLLHTTAFAFAGRRLELQISPLPDYLGRQRWEAWTVLVAELLFTGLLGVFLLAATGRASKVELLVEQRTTDLAASNASLRQLASIVESSSDAIVGMTLDGTIVSWNQGAERTFGYAAHEVHGRKITVLHTDHTSDRLRSPEQWLGAGGSAWSFETLNRTKDGREIDVSLTISPLKGADDRIVGIASIARDITERKRIEDALAAERKFLAAVLDSLKEGIVACDGDGMLTVFNRATQELYGLPPEPLPPEQWAERYHLYLADGVTRMRPEEVPLFRALRGEIVNDVEMVIAVRGREPRTLLANGQAVHDPRGNRLGAVVAMHDITERKVLERAKDDFIGTVSHELRTPLTAIKGFVELVAEGEAGPISSQQKEFLDIAARGTDRLAALVNDLLDVNRIESGTFHIRHDRVDLVGVLDEVASTFRFTAETKHLDFALELEPLQPVVGDRDRLIQVFSNLVSNAIKYTPTGRVRIRGRARGEFADVDVEDSGIGLTPEEQAQLFTKFFRADNPVVSEAGGTGLGLVIVKAIVERHGGALELESRKGQGTHVRVTLPIA